jgi:hypothetical protein
MPLQRVVECDTPADQPLAVIDEQPRIELRALQLRGWQGIQPFAQRRPRDRDRVDAAGLPARERGDVSRPSASSSRARPARRVRSRALKGTRDMPRPAPASRAMAISAVRKLTARA